jgi:hypothetical protein
MQGEIHFISGLPRAGSTLLSAILRQNPRFRAGMTGPVGSLVDAMLRNMSMSNETSIFITVNFEPGGTVYSRVEGLASPSGMVGFAWNALREAFCGEQTSCLLALTYETLTSQPEKAVSAVYDFIGEKPFAHDFENIEFDAEEFDRRLGTPGLHKVGRKVESTGRQTLLPGDLVRKYENDAFWRDPARNPHQVKVI